MQAKSTFDIEKAAHLAQLTLTPEEKELFSAQIRGLLRFADSLPAATEEELRENVCSVLREDVPHGCLAREALLANTRESADGFFTVPRTVFGEDGNG